MKYNSSQNKKAKNNGKTFVIDWKRVNKMSSAGQLAYFKKLHTDILKAPITNPVPVLLGTKYYATDEKYKDLLVEVYNRILALKEGNRITTSFEIDWKVVAKLTLAERIVYFRDVIKKIESEPIINPTAFKTSFGLSVINREREEIYKECLRHYEAALNGIDLCPKESQNKRKENTKKLKARRFENVPIKPEGQRSEDTAKKVEDKPIEQFVLREEPVTVEAPVEKSPVEENVEIDETVRKVQKGLPPLYVKPKGRLVCSIVATGLIVHYAANLLLSALPGIILPKIKEKEPEVPPSIFSSMSIEEAMQLHHDMILANNPYFMIVDSKLEKELKDITEAALQKREEKRIAEEKAKRVALIDEYFKEYCVYFNLDCEQIIQIAKDKTNEYEISLTTLFEDHLYDDVDVEAAVMVFVRQIARDRLGFKLEELGLTKESIKGTNNQIALQSSVIEETNKLTFDTSQTADYYEHKSPVDFLRSLSIEPTREDLNILYFLMEDFHFDYGVINVLIDYTLKIHDNQLDATFILTNAEMWRKFNVQSAAEALVVSKNVSSPIVNVDEEEPVEPPIVYSEFLYPTLNEDGVPVARNGEVFSEFIGRVSEMIHLDRNYSLALCLHETWRGTSTLCLQQNNYGGMRANGDWFTFPSPEAGMIAFCMNLNGYKKYNLKSWQRFADIYAEGSENWQKNYQAFHREVIRDSEKYFGVGVEESILSSIEEEPETTATQKRLVLEQKNN